MKPIFPSNQLLRAALVMALTLAVAGTATAQQADDPTQPPPPLAERTVDFPDFQRTTTSNGLEMIVVEHFGQPVVNINLYIRGGEAADPAPLAGRAGFVADLLTKGTTSRSAEEISETIEGVGGRLNAFSGGDWMSVSSTVLVEHADLAFDLISDVTLNPTFPENELETTRRRTLSALQAQLGQPGAIAQRRFLATLYGDHPYGISAVPATVREVSRGDLTDFHSAFFHPDNALLVVSGAVTADQALALAEQHFGQWEGEATQRVGFPTLTERQGTQIHLVHRPGSVQSSIWIGHEGIGPGHPDYFPLVVMNRVLGQGSDARLFRILREERGWTYGAYSRFTRPADRGYFAATTEVRTEVTDSSVVEILHQLRRLQTEEIPSDEFEGSVSFLAGSFPLRIETPGQIASQVAEAHLLGLSPEDVTDFRARITAVTPDDVRRVAGEHLRPDDVAIIVVGDANEILEGLEAIAPVRLYDVEGEPMDREALVVRAPEERFDASVLHAYTRTYQLMVQGNPMGTVTERIERDGDDWLASTQIESMVMSQEAELRFNATDFTPVFANQRVQQGPMTMQTDLRVENGRILGRAEMPDQMGGNRDIDIEYVEGTLLPGMDSHVLGAANLTDGREITLPVFNAMAGAISNVTFTVTGTDVVTVPAGDFEAFVVEVSGPQPMTLYVSQDAPHTVLRQEFAGQPVAIELVSAE